LSGDHSANIQEAFAVTSTSGIRSWLVVFACLFVVVPGLAAGAGLDPDKEIAPFAREVAKRHGLDEGYVKKVLAGAKVLNKVLKAMSRPAEGKPWRDYRPIFLNERRIKDGVEFWRRNRATLERAEEQFGVPARVMVAIIGVETLYGTRAGNIRVLDALATLGFRYPKRAAFFSRELGHFLVLGEQEKLDLNRVNGSYAGAMGIPQFIPSSYREYAVDFDGDGRRDLLNSTEDAIGSVGAYLGRHGWVRGQPVTTTVSITSAAPDAVASAVARGIKPATVVDEFIAAGLMPSETVEGAGKAALIELNGKAGKEYWLGLKNFYVITRYNHSKLYAMAVYQLSEAIAARFAGKGG
jgi:membrane-bound lytic murein transglycosylase B